MNRWSSERRAELALAIPSRDRGRKLFKGRSGGSCFLLLLFFRDKRKGDIGVWGYPPGVGVVVEERDGMDDGMDGVVVVGMDGVGMVLHVT